MSHTYAIEFSKEILAAAQPVIRLKGLGGKRWKRNVAKGSRIGPWLQASYELLNHSVWERREPCLYLVAGGNGVIRYVGISRNRLKDRWRLSPALDAETMVPLAERQLFHSQCWKHIEREVLNEMEAEYEVRCISGEQLLPLLEKAGPPLSGFALLKGDNEGIVNCIERWICNNKNDRLAIWNIAMTA